MHIVVVVVVVFVIFHTLDNTRITHELKSCKPGVFPLKCNIIHQYKSQDFKRIPVCIRSVSVFVEVSCIITYHSDTYRYEHNVKNHKH